MLNRSRQQAYVKTGEKRYKVREFSWGWRKAFLCGIRHSAGSALLLTGTTSNISANKCYPNLSLILPSIWRINIMSKHTRCLDMTKWQHELGPHVWRGPVSGRQCPAASCLDRYLPSLCSTDVSRACGVLTQLPSAVLIHSYSTRYWLQVTIQGTTESNSLAMFA